MSSRDQIAAQIRFQLDQLSVRNGHHDFEHLCRHLARLRICSNILPATGPVSAGGDQGRDFETFRTYLSESPIAGSSFVGLASQEPIAFACTLTQKDSLRAKIKSDVAVIKGGGAPVADIHYFCVSDLPVASRHELQAWANEEHGVHLEIYDGQAISELLVESDVFWIATRYLSISAEIYPAPPSNERDGKYFSLRDKWKKSDLQPSNFADFFELKSAVRYAKRNKSVKQDLPFWIEKLESLKNDTTWIPLQRRSTYEIAVASLRGLGTLEGQTDQLRAYFGDVPGLYEASDLEDAETLWLYCAGAHRRGLLQIPREEVTDWRDMIVLKLETELSNTDLPGRRCSLLEIRGHIALTMSVSAPDATVDFASALSYWEELANLAEQAPLFPLERFADRLTELVKFGDPPDLDHLTNRLDELLAARRGQAAAAEKCRDRAVALYQMGEIVKAIKQIHKAKVKWFSEETVHGSILAMLFLSRCYFDLRLMFAAKYYALIAAYTAFKAPRENSKKLVPEALSTAAMCDYLQGAWLGFLNLEYITLATFSTFSREEDPLDPHSEINKALLHISMIYRLAQLLDPALAPFIKDQAGRWHLREEFDEFLEHLDDPWSGKELGEIWNSLENQLMGRPFSDVGSRREVSFKALGVTWAFRWDNTYQMTAAAEQFLAVLQIILADFAGVDLCLLRTTVDVDIQAGSGEEILTREVPSNESTKWEVLLPSVMRSEGTGMELTAEVTAATTTLLHSASLLPSSRLLEILKDAFRNGLTTKVFSVDRYERLYHEFTSEDDFGNSRRCSNSVPEPGRSFNSTVLHPQLAWIAGLGPGYTKENAEERLRNRYRRTVAPIQRTLGWLVQQQEFQEVVRTLRRKGWLDWHILQAVMNLTLNYRIERAQHFGLSLKEVNELADQWGNEEERENSIPVPLEKFSADNLQLQLRNSMIQTVKLYGLELPHGTPDLEAISDFFAERYRYWLDDVEHPEFGF